MPERLPLAASLNASRTSGAVSESGSIHTSSPRGLAVPVADRGIAGENARLRLPRHPGLFCVFHEAGLLLYEWKVERVAVMTPAALRRRHRVLDSTGIQTLESSSTSSSVAAEQKVQTKYLLSDQISFTRKSRHNISFESHFFLVQTRT